MTKNQSEKKNVKNNKGGDTIIKYESIVGEGYKVFGGGIKDW